MYAGADCRFSSRLRATGAGMEANLKKSRPDMTDRLMNRRLSMREPEEKASARQAMHAIEQSMALAFMIREFDAVI